MAAYCRTCGQLSGIDAYDDELWAIYERLPDGRQHYEPLVFDSGWLQENVFDEDDHAAVNLAMSRDMHNRGLCVSCGRPNMAGIDPATLLSEDEAQAMAESYAEQRAERRMGC